MPATPKPNFWLQDLLASLAVFSGVGYVATAYTVSRWLTRTSPHKPALPDDDAAWSLEPLECRTSDGLRLAGWAIAPADPIATVALFHGLRGNRARTLNRIAFLTRAGYRCVAFDHRAHGQSEGRHTSFGYYEGRDVSAVLELIRQRWPHQPRAALGISMGAAALCYAAPSTRAFGAVILESLYHDLASAFQNRVGCDFPRWFSRFSKGVIWLTERRLGLRIREMAPIHYIHDLAPTPILLLTGADDPHATPAEVQDIYDHCPGPREFQIIPDANHTDVCEKGGATYQAMILDFLQRRLAA